MYDLTLSSINNAWYALLLIMFHLLEARARLPLALGA